MDFLKTKVYTKKATKIIFVEKVTTMIKYNQNQKGEMVEHPSGRIVPDDETSATSTGEMANQMVMTRSGNILDPDTYIEPPANIVEISEDGTIISENDEKTIRAYIKEALSVPNLIATFNSNAHDALLKLMAIQDNAHPLKRGGVNVAFRADALIRYFKMEVSAEANIVFDVITAVISSYPDNTSYRISPADFKDYLKVEDSKYYYNIFKRGCATLKKSHLVIKNPDGSDNGLEIPWYTILNYNMRRAGESAYIEFAPTDFFKDLMLSSGIIHGAHYNIKTVTQLKGKYIMGLFYLLEDYKDYREHRYATPGSFDLEIDDLKFLLCIPSTYNAFDIKRRILEPAYENINSIEECDFTFEYSKVKKGNAIVGYHFDVRKKILIEDKSESKNFLEEKEDPFTGQITQLLSAIGITLKKEETKRVVEMARKNHRDIGFITQAAGIVLSRKDIVNQASYLIKILESGILSVKNTEKPNKFNNFEQRDYDYKELERQILDAQENN